MRRPTGRISKANRTFIAAEPGGGFRERLRAIPLWVRWTVALLVLVVLPVGLSALFYRSLDGLYPQSLWKYFRPLTPAATGSLLYRDADGQLFLAALDGAREPRRIADPALGGDTHEIVRDAVAVPGGKQIAYFATERRTSGERDVLKIANLEDGSVRRADSGSVIEPLRAAVFASTSGRYVAVTSRDRTHAYYFDLSGGGALTLGTAENPPERMLWTRNADLRNAALPGQSAFAISPDGKLRAQVRDGQRRAPECDEARCEAVQELSVTPASIAGSQRAPAIIYGAFSSFSADGWGVIPEQPAQRFYGRLVWSPDSRQLVFSTIDGANERVYAISVDGRNQPRIVRDAAEALDWLP